MSSFDNPPPYNPYFLKHSSLAQRLLNKDCLDDTIAECVYTIIFEQVKCDLISSFSRNDIKSIHCITDDFLKNHSICTNKTIVDVIINHLTSKLKQEGFWIYPPIKPGFYLLVSLVEINQV